MLHISFNPYWLINRAVLPTEIKKKYSYKHPIGEPMARLISAWKDKVNRPTAWKDASRRIKNMLHFAGKSSCAANITTAWEDGCRVTFPDFIEWIANGNQAANIHWTPAVQICIPCQANFTFIGHAEHYDDDIQVCCSRKRLRICAILSLPHHPMLICV